MEEPQMNTDKRGWKKIGFAAAFAVLAVTLADAQQKAVKKPGEENTNLIKNGHFDDAEDPLNHWIYVFDHNKHYMKNHTYVSAEADKASMREHVLKLDVSDSGVCINQGVQVYTEPIRFDPKKKYKISLSARSVGVKGGRGATSRVYAIGYRWHPKAVKSNNPSFADLREEVRFQPIYFNNAETGEMSNIPQQWKRAERVIPTPGRSELQQSHLENCEWLMLKIIALDGGGVPSYVYIDDVKIEEIGLADEVKITSGSATKGFSGSKNWNDSSTDGKKAFVPIGGPVKSSSKK
jgi:hypothetical protein